jgi:predicted MPP superfamily phosphohydrolase
MGSPIWFYDLLLAIPFDCYSNDLKSCQFCHEAGTGQPTKRRRIRFLRNSVERVSTDDETLKIMGLENESGSRMVDVPGNSPNRVSMEASIILSHSPLIFDEIAGGEGVLVLAGDTHGEQFWLPNWLWSSMRYEKNAKYDQELFKKGDNQMFVSKGLGTSHLRFRRMRRPELVVVHFL